MLVSKHTTAPDLGAPSSSPHTKRQPSPRAMSPEAGVVPLKTRKVLKKDGVTVIPLSVALDPLVPSSASSSTSHLSFSVKPALDPLVPSSASSSTSNLSFSVKSALERCSPTSSTAPSMAPSTRTSCVSGSSVTTSGMSSCADSQSSRSGGHSCLSGTSTISGPASFLDVGPSTSSSPSTSNSCLPAKYDNSCLPAKYVSEVQSEAQARAEAAVGMTLDQAYSIMPSPPQPDSEHTQSKQLAKQAQNISSSPVLSPLAPFCMNLPPLSSPTAAGMAPNLNNLTHSQLSMTPALAAVQSPSSHTDILPTLLSLVSTRAASAITSEKFQKAFLKAVEAISSVERVGMQEMAAEQENPSHGGFAHTADSSQAAMLQLLASTASTVPNTFSRATDGAGEHATSASKASKKRLGRRAQNKKARKFLCLMPDCGERFPTQYSLKRHQKRHSGVRPYVCSVEGCDSRFAEKSTLQRHLQMHQGLRPFLCKHPNCGRRYADRLTCQKHEAKPHVNTTGKSQKNSSNLNMLHSSSPDPSNTSADNSSAGESGEDNASQAHGSTSPPESTMT